MTPCCSVIRHQPPPIVPAFVHSLKAKEYPREQSHAFNDEVPYAKGVISPRMARQTANKKRIVSPTSQRVSTSLLPSLEQLTPASTAANASPQSPTNPIVGLDESRTSSSTGTAALSADMSAMAPHIPSTDRPAPMNSSSLQSSAPGSHKPPQSAPAAVLTGTAVEDVALSFDYSAGPSSLYWSNSESSQSLRASLSGLLGTGT